MQKKVIALAVAGLVSGAAFAQTSVTLSGTVDLGYNTGKDKWTDEGAPSVHHKYTNFRGGDGKGMSSSRLNIDVKEQLGNGLKAGYFHELGLFHFAGDHNDSILGTDGVQTKAVAFNRTRQSFAYLESANAGRFQIGLANLITDDQTGFANVGSRNHVGHAYNATFYSDPNGGYNAKAVDAMDLARANTISYYSPSFSGFQVMAQAGYGKSELDHGSTSTDSSYKIYNIGLKYANGPVTAYLGGQKYKTDINSTAASEEDRREFIVAAAYDFGVAKLTGMYFDRKADYDLSNGANYGTRKYRGGDIGVTVPLGQAELFANFGMGKNKYNLDSSLLDDKEWKIRTYQIGSRYNLSKRTNIYALYGYGKAKGETRGDGTGKRNVVSVGLRHSF